MLSTFKSIIRPVQAKKQAVYLKFPASSSSFSAISPYSFQATAEKLVCLPVSWHLPAAPTFLSFFIEGGGFVQIEKNIAATLRHRMEAEKKSKLEFSKELGIPRSTFQGYLKGENCLRSDSIEEIAKGLNITPAQLISGPEDAAAESLRLETLLPQIPALHPQAQRLAKDAIALLQTAFRVSQELMCIDAHASEQDAPEGAYRYFLQETWQPARMRCSYGLLGQQRQSGCWTTLAVISPFSDDRAAVERLAKLCTTQQLDPVHLFDVIHDFLDQEAASV